MAEEKKDVNTEQTVVAQDVNQLVTGDDVTQVTTEEKDEKDKQAVPYERFKEVNDAKNTAEELLAKQTQDHQNQMAILQANQQPVQTQTQPLSDYDQAKADLGLTGEEYLDESQRSKVHTRMVELTNVRGVQANAAFSNQQFEVSHPDFGSVVGLYNPLTGKVQPTAEIQKIITEKPYLAAAANASSQGAYEVVMNERRLQELTQQNTVQEEHLKQQGIDTKLAPVSGAAAAGGALPAQTTGTVTLEQQQQAEERVAAGEFNKKG